MKTLIRSCFVVLALGASSLAGAASTQVSSASAVGAAAAIELAFLQLPEATTLRNCRYSTECNPGEHCMNGVCQIREPGNRCLFKADCPPAEDCIGGYCRRR